MSETMYVRARGRVMGPFDVEKLKVMARRRQLHRIHELSPDGVDWQRASDFPHLFEIGSFAVPSDPDEEDRSKTESPPQLAQASQPDGLTLRPPNLAEAVRLEESLDPDPRVAPAVPLSAQNEGDSGTAAGRGNHMLWVALGTGAGAAVVGAIVVISMGSWSPQTPPPRVAASTAIQPPEGSRPKPVFADLLREGQQRIDQDDRADPAASAVPEPNRAGQSNAEAPRELTEVNRPLEPRPGGTGRGTQRPPAEKSAQEKRLPENPRQRGSAHPTFILSQTALTTPQPDQLAYRGRPFTVAEITQGRVTEVKLMGGKMVAEGHFELLDEAWDSGRVEGSVLYYYSPATVSKKVIKDRYAVARVTGISAAGGTKVPFSFRWHEDLEPWPKLIAEDFFRLSFLQLHVKMGDKEKIVIPLGQPAEAERLAFSTTGAESPLCRACSLPFGGTNTSYWLAKSQFSMTVDGLPGWRITVDPGLFPLAGRITASNSSAPAATFAIEYIESARTLVMSAVRVSGRDGLLAQLRDVLKHVDAAMQTQRSRETRLQKEVAEAQQRVNQLTLRANRQPNTFESQLKLARGQLAQAQQERKKLAHAPLAKAIADFDPLVQRLKGVGVEIGKLWSQNEEAKTNRSIRAADLVKIAELSRQLAELREKRREFLLTVQDAEFQDFLEKSRDVSRLLARDPFLQLVQLLSDDGAEGRLPAYQFELRYKVLQGGEEPLEFLLARYRATANDKLEGTF